MRRQEQPQVPFVLGETCIAYCFSCIGPHCTSGLVDLSETPHLHLPGDIAPSCLQSKGAQYGEPKSTLWGMFLQRSYTSRHTQEQKLHVPSEQVDLSYFKVFLSVDFTCPIPGLDHSSTSYPLQSEASKLVKEKTYVQQTWVIHTIGSP